MSAAPSVLNIERHHVKELVDLLDQQAAAFLSDTATGKDSWRVYFADSDVLSTFVNGSSKNPISDWSSLLSLGESGDNRRRQVSPAAESLANVTGQAVVRYLFGAFRKNAEIQRRRLFITPEHEREFNSIVLALLHRQASAESGWLDCLRDCYLKLAKQGGAAKSGRESAHEIVRLLESNADHGAVDRAYTLLRDSIAPFSSHLLTPPGGRAKPFLFATTDPEFRALTEISRGQVWRAFSISIIKRVPGIGDLLALKQIVFKFHETPDAATRPFAYFRDRAMHWLGSDEAPPALLARKDMEMQIKIAAVEAADLTAIAKIDAFGRWLNKNRNPPNNTSWEPVLIGGSRMLEDVLRLWREGGDGPVVRLMHPLALLRRVDLWDPAGTRRLQDADYLDQPHEFALSLIFRSAKEGTGNAAENVEAFTTSLRAQLELVVAREAEVGDRGLVRLRRMLESHEAFDRNEYREAVRDLVSQRFVETYLHLTELFPGVTHQLPASSLPPLDLPLSRSAMRFMAHVRNSMLKDQPPALETDDLQRSIREDPTGYSALLCSAIGYMARGSTWLSAAKTMSATAVLLAKGRGDVRYPEGNEALYLDAFLQRMTLKREDNVERFARAHGEIMAEALKTLHQWAAQNSDVAQERLGEDQTTPTRLEWIDYRYRLEICARESFVVLHRVLQNRTSDLPWEQLAESAHTSLALHRKGVSLVGAKESWQALHRPSIWYCGIQAGMSLLQMWLCWRELLPSHDAESSTRLSAYETELEPVVAGWWWHREKLGKLLPLLAVIFAQYTGYAGQWRKTRVDATQFNVSFAAIDKERFAWLRHHWQSGLKRLR